MTTLLEQRRGSDFAALARQMRAARLLERRYGHYTLRITATLVVFAAGWVAFARMGSTWFQLLIAAGLGVVSTQIAFLGHDGAHQQIAGSRRANTWFGLMAGNLLTGLSIGWWMDKHNRHHANPNKEGHDPDIGEGVLAFTAAQAAARRGRFARAITRHQAALFFPLLTLEGLNLHVASVRWLLQSREAKRRRLEALLLAVHGVAYVGGVLLVLPPLAALAFIGVHQAAFGFYMGCSFAPNHKGMPIIGADEKLDFLSRQVLTSRNVRGGWFVDQVLGGLNYQIEHHLFPSLPRPNLRRAQRLVRQYCAERQLAYTETSLVRSYRMALGHLHALGRR